MFGSGSTIRRRLSVVVFLSIALTVIGVAAASVWREADRAARATSVELEATAGVFATAAAGAVAERDRAATRGVLKAIGRIPGFSYARVEDNWGRLVAEIGSGVQLVGEAGRTAAANRLDLLAGKPVEITVPVVRGGVEVGRLFVLSRPVDLWPRIVSGITDTLILAFVAGLVALAAAIRLSRSIADPIADLARTMARVRDEQDFSRTVRRGTIAEVSLLADAFDDMMANIRERDDRLARHRARLEQDVAARTRDLKEAKDAAEAANAAKSDFLATMSHEIRTPMNGMLVMAELLSKAELSANLRRYAEVIASSGRSLMTIIDDILDLSKIEAGKLDLECVEMRLTETVRDVLVLFQERAGEKGLELVGHVAPDVADAVLGDPVRLRQIVGNLVGNAIKFTERGHVAVTVESLGTAPGGGQQLRITVADTGIGIPKDKIATIFEAFSQADQSTTRRFGGTGLGLAICRRLAEAFGGRIHAESVPGEGSRFVVQFACAPAAAPTAAPDMPRPASAERALVAVEGPQFAAVLQRTLGDLGVAAAAADAEVCAAAGPGTIVFAELETLAALERPDFAERPDGPFYLAVAAIGAPEAEDACRRGLADAVLYRPALAPDIADALAMLTPEGRAALEGRQAAAAETGAVPHWPEARVLVADDSPVNQEVAREALARFGIVPKVVADGAAALKCSTSTPYDLILMDCSMPVMDGYEATRRLRAAEAASGSRRVPVVALTAQVMDGARHQCQAAGMDDMLAKPFSLDDLARCLARHLGEAAGEAAAPAASAPPPADPASPARAAILRTDHLDALGGAAGAGAGMLERVLGLFEHHAPAALEEVRVAVAGSDPAEVAAAAHALKSMSANIGAERLAALCGEMERAAKEGGKACFDANVAALGSSLDEALAAVAMFRRMLAPSGKLAL